MKKILVMAAAAIVAIGFFGGIAYFIWSVEMSERRDEQELLNKALQSDGLSSNQKDALQFFHDYPWLVVIIAFAVCALVYEGVKKLIRWGKGSPTNPNTQQ